MNVGGEAERKANMTQGKAIQNAPQERTCTEGMLERKAAQATISINVDFQNTTKQKK